MPLFFVVVILKELMTLFMANSRVASCGDDFNSFEEQKTKNKKTINQREIIPGC